MPFTFANPLGLLALLGVPAVLAIHFLQRQTRVIPVATLFLLEPRREHSRLGRRFERLMTSLPMWLQLLAVILLAAYLAQPRLPVAGSVQRVALVLDDSASMRAFKPELLRQLDKLMQRCQSRARRVEYLVLLADPTRPRLYAGTSAAGLREAVERWDPLGGRVDPTGNLRLARERVGGKGLLVYVTDTPRDDLPADAVLLAVGRPLANVGIAGLTISAHQGQAIWRAFVANHGPAPQQRAWHLEWDDGNRGAETTAQIPAGGMTTLQGAIPGGAKRLRLVLQPDEFDLDDSFAFVPAAPKALLVRHDLPAELQWLPQRLTHSVPALTESPAPDQADLVLTASRDGKPVNPPGPAILMTAAGNAAAKTLAGPVVAARHALVAGLSWEALTVQDVPPLPPQANDVVLVWCGERPLVSLRPQVVATADPPLDAASPGVPQLVLHFNPEWSNWKRLPAAAVLLWRYCEEIRRAKRGTACEQLEPRQLLEPLLPADPRGPLALDTLSLTGKVLDSQQIAPAARAALRAPEHGGFLSVREGETILIDAAVAFADPREGDFRACAAHTGLTNLSAVGAADDALEAWWPLVMLVVLAASLVSWAATGKESRRDATVAAGC